MSLRTQSNVVRRNRFFYNDGPGLSLYTGTGQPYNADHIHIYHNVFFHNGFTAISMSGSDLRYHSGLLFENSGGTGGTPIVGVAVKNNLFYDNNGTSVAFYYTDPSAQDILGNYYQAADGWGSSGHSVLDLSSGNPKDSASPLFVNTSGVPDLSNPDQFDFHVQAGSPALESGVFLTITTTAGTGTVIPVVDAGYFIDGFGIVSGDRIQLEGQTQTAAIVSIDYATNEITVDVALTWTAGLGVSLPYAGAAPDIGVYEQ
jgi:hypothetical protein